MTDREHHVQQLFTAELQFRLASAVRLAVTGNRQPLDLPMEWVHGQHRVRYEEVALRFLLAHNPIFRGILAESRSSGEPIPHDEFWKLVAKRRSRPSHGAEQKPSSRRRR